MTGHRALMISVAVVVLGMTDGPVAAGGLVGQVSGAVGGVTGGATSGVTNTLGGGGGGAVGSVTGAVGSVGGAVGGGAKASVGVGLGGAASLARVTAKSDLLHGIDAKLVVLSKKQLVKLCLNVGGGSGCGNGERRQLLGLIDSRLAVLPKTSLANLCLSLGGGGCGGASGGGGSGGGGGGSGGGGSGGGGVDPGTVRVYVAGLSSEEQRDLKIRCRDVLRQPTGYSKTLVTICRFIRGG